MLPFVLIALLVVASGVPYLRLTERYVRDLGVGFIAVSSILAVIIAWPGFTAAGRIFGPASLWYLDSLAALLMCLIAGISLTSSLVAHRYLAREHREGVISLTDLRLFSSMMPLFIAAMYVATLSNHMGLLWIALEATTLSTTLLISFYRRQSAIEAAWKYLLLCSLGMSLALVGVLLTVSAAGQAGITSSLLLSTFRDLAANGGVNGGLMRWAFVFLFIGLGTKIGFVPLHTWLPDAHSKAPSPVSALLSGVLLNVALVALLRFRQVTDMALLDDGAWTGRFFLVFGTISIVVPALILLIQKNYKRLLAYSSIEHMGLIAFAIGLGPAGLIPAMMHIPGHALLKSALFFGAGEIFATYKTTDSAQVRDAGSRLPKTAILFLLALLLLLAVPPSAIFVSQMIMLGFGLQTFLIPCLLVSVSLTVVCVAMSRHVYGMLYGVSSAHVQTQPVTEKWQSLHLIIGIHLVLAAGLGLWFLTPSGLQFMVTIAQSLNSTML